MSRTALMGLTWGFTIASGVLLFVNGFASFLVGLGAFFSAWLAWEKKGD